MNQTAAPARQLIIIDSQINNWQTLANNISPDNPILILNPAADRPTQISDYLKGLSNTTGFLPLQSIHIISHGNIGSLLLGASTLTTSNLSQYSQQLADIGDALTETGDIFLYGCQVAAEPQGKAFIELFAELTQADVAASDDMTGLASLGGDWLLEANTGLIDSTSITTSVDIAAQLALANIESLATGTAATDIVFNSRYTGQAANSIYEELPKGITLGSLSATDVDTNEAHTFSFVAGNGDTDNARFIIDGDQLKLAANTVLDFETKPSYNLRIQTIDAGGNSFEKALSINLVDVQEPHTALYSGMGGSAGFGENQLNRNDDRSTGAIDITSIFPTGINFFGTHYTRLYINNNGNITFNKSADTYIPYAITGNTANPIIAAFFTDVDTSAGVLHPSPGGTSTGSNLLYWDFDAAAHTFTVTWDDVGAYYRQIVRQIVPNAFQIRLTDLGNGDFTLEYRYESIDWDHGDANNNARAGYSAADGVHFYEFPGSGTVSLLNLEQTSNVGQPGLYTVTVNSGIPNQRPQLQNPLADAQATEDGAFSYTVASNAFADPDLADVLAYRATLPNGSPLPAWLSFDPSTRTFSGTPTNSEVGTLTVRVTATDPVNAYTSDDFVITVINTNDAPTNLSINTPAIDENAANGTLVGTISTVDVDLGDTHTYQLLDNAGGRFAIAGNSLKVADGSLLDYEQAHTHTVSRVVG